MITRTEPMNWVRTGSGEEPSAKDQQELIDPVKAEECEDLPAQVIQDTLHVVQFKTEEPLAIPLVDTKKQVKNELENCPKSCDFWKVKVEEEDEHSAGDAQHSVGSMKVEVGAELTNGDYLNSNHQVKTAVGETPPVPMWQSLSCVADLQDPLIHTRVTNIVRKDPLALRKRARFEVEEEERFPTDPHESVEGGISEGPATAGTSCPPISAVDEDPGPSGVSWTWKYFRLPAGVVAREATIVTCDLCNRSVRRGLPSATFALGTSAMSIHLRRQHGMTRESKPSFACSNPRKPAAAVGGMGAAAIGEREEISPGAPDGCSLVVGQGMSSIPTRPNALECSISVPAPAVCEPILGTVVMSCRYCGNMLGCGETLVSTVLKTVRIHMQTRHQDQYQLLCDEEQAIHRRRQQQMPVGAPATSTTAGPECDEDEDSQQ